MTDKSDTVSLVADLSADTDVPLTSDLSASVRDGGNLIALSRTNELAFVVLPTETVVRYDRSAAAVVEFLNAYESPDRERVVSVQYEETADAGTKRYGVLVTSTTTYYGPAPQPDAVQQARYSYAEFAAVVGLATRILRHRGTAR